MLGLCRADRLLCITTGRDFSQPGTAPLEMGARTVEEALCRMYGIAQFRSCARKGLDDVRNDRAALLAQTMERVDALAEMFLMPPEGGAPFARLEWLKQQKRIWFIPDPLC